MDNCRAQIVRYFRELPPGTLFTTRDCLGTGERPNVDKTLSRLVKEGTLIRIVRGMFVHAETARAYYGTDEIAALKASSFGKRILEHCADAAASIGLEVERNNQQTYLVNGSTSKFHLVKGWVQVDMRTACAKKMHLPDSKAGRVVRGLWHFGSKAKITRDVFIRATSTLTREDCQLIMDSCAWMPLWLSDIFVTVYGHRFRFRPRNHMPEQTD